MKPDDVIIDGGTDYESNAPEARPRTLLKHVILRVDRADGFVAHNFTVRGALEHGLYIEEADGYRLDTREVLLGRRLRQPHLHLRPRPLHGLRRLRRRRRGALPGRRARRPASRPTCPSIPTRRGSTPSSALRHARHVLAYSGSMGNAVRLTNNNIYGNTAGISTDTISAGGHPGYPADSVEVDHNWIYSNNLDLFATNPPVEPVVGVLPFGVGDLLGRPQQRPGARQLDLRQLACGACCSRSPTPRHSRGQHQPGRLLQRPRGTRRSRPPAGTATTTTTGPRAQGLQAVRRALPVRQQRGADARGRAERRGLLVGRGRPRNRPGNCWFNNVGADGTLAGVTGSGVGDGNDSLPTDCTSTRGGDGVKLSYLLSCFMAREGDLAAGAVRLVHAAAAARLARGDGEAEGVRAGCARVPRDRASQAAPGPGRRDHGNLGLGAPGIAQ